MSRLKFLLAFLTEQNPRPGIESANFADQSQEEIDRLLSFVVVGGGPTGVEYAGELHDFLKEDLANASRRFVPERRLCSRQSCTQWYPDIVDRIKITLIEALPNVLPMFSKQLMSVSLSAACALPSMLIRTLH